jgi:hypothetical protein
MARKTDTILDTEITSISEGIRTLATHVDLIDIVLRYSNDKPEIIAGQSLERFVKMNKNLEDDILDVSSILVSLNEIGLNSQQRKRITELQKILLEISKRNKKNLEIICKNAEPAAYV